MELYFALPISGQAKEKQGVEVRRKPPVSDREKACRILNGAGSRRNGGRVARRKRGQGDSEVEQKGVRLGGSVREPFNMILATVRKDLF